MEATGLTATRCPALSGPPIARADARHVFRTQTVGGTGLGRVSSASSQHREAWRRGVTLATSASARDGTKPWESAKGLTAADLGGVSFLRSLGLLRREPAGILSGLG